MEDYKKDPNIDRNYTDYMDTLSIDTDELYGRVMKRVDKKSRVMFKHVGMVACTVVLLVAMVGIIVGVVSNPIGWSYPGGTIQTNSPNPTNTESPESPESPTASSTPHVTTPPPITTIPTNSDFLWRCEYADVFVNGLGANTLEISFILRNTSGRGLYYGNGYRLYRYMEGNWEIWEVVAMPSDSAGYSQEISNYIGENIAISCGISWGDELAAGRYRFERDFFPDLGDINNYITVAFEFDAIPWPVLLEAEGSPASRIRWRQHRQAWIDFAILGGSSEIIVPVIGSLQVRPNRIDYSFANRSSEDYVLNSFGALAQYVDGKWQFLLGIGDANDLLVCEMFQSIQGSTIPMPILRLVIRGGSIEPSMGIPLGRPPVERLAPGRYIVIRSFSPTDRMPGDSRNQEHLIIEFTVN